MSRYPAEAAAMAARAMIAAGTYPLGAVDPSPAGTALGRVAAAGTDTVAGLGADTASGPLPPAVVPAAGAETIRGSGELDGGVLGSGVDVCEGLGEGEGEDVDVDVGDGDGEGDGDGDVVGEGEGDGVGAGLQFLALQSEFQLAFSSL